VPLAPTPPEERVPGLDILRGLALCGVLLENMQHFASPSYSEWAFGAQGSAADRAVVWGLRLLCDNKVYMLFALLFGHGIGLQLRRAAASQAGFAGLQLWRMGTLALIGFAHSLLWEGDILFTYALLAVLLLPLRARSSALLRRVAAVFLCLPSAALAAAWAGAAWAGLAPGARAGFDAALGEHLYPLRQSCFAFAMLAVGFAAGRAGALPGTPALGAATRRRLPLAAALALAGHGVGLALMARARGTALSAPGVALEASIAVGAPALVYLYAAGALRWLESAAWRRRLRPLAALGRTTLSNYLLQSVLGVVVLARAQDAFGPLSPPAGVALSCAILALQVAASAAWLRRFRFGPVEWLWRALSYAQAPPLRREAR
jgi:uncharacterized protein